MSHPPMKSWLPSQSPRAVIIALHSFGDFSAAFDQLGPWLADRGYAVFAWDQRGFGDNPHAGHWPGAKPLEDDVRFHIRQLHQQYQAPIYLLGESLGGAVAINVAGHDPQLPIAGLILAAPAVREGIPWRYGWNIAIATASLFAPGHLLEVKRTPDDPRFRPDAARRLATDPRVLREVRMDNYWGLIRYADRASDIAPRLDVPVMLMYGGDDESVPAVSISRFCQHLGDKCDYRFYRKAPHLLLQGVHWQQVASDMLGWLRRERVHNIAHAAELSPNPAH